MLCMIMVIHAFLSYFIALNLFLYMYEHTRGPQGICGGQRRTCRSLFFYCHLCPGDWTRAIKLGGKHFYPLTNLIGPTFYNNLLDQVLLPGALIWWMDAGKLLSASHPHALIWQTDAGTLKSINKSGTRHITQTTLTDRWTFFCQLGPHSCDDDGWKTRTFLWIPENTDSM